MAIGQAKNHFFMVMVIEKYWFDLRNCFFSFSKIINCFINRQRPLATLFQGKKNLSQSYAHVMLRDFTTTW